ncbi:hypothetical protein RYX36_002479, partial [Vicia faba]
MKKIVLKKEETITPKQSKNDRNQEWIPALETKVLNFIYNLEPRLVFQTFKIREAFLRFINKLAIVEKIIRAAITFIKEFYKCAKPYIIGLVKAIMRLLIGLLKVLVSLAIIIIKIIIQMLIGLVRTL